MAVLTLHLAWKLFDIFFLKFVCQPVVLSNLVKYQSQCPHIRREGVLFTLVYFWRHVDGGAASRGEASAIDFYQS